MTATMTPWVSAIRARQRGDVDELFRLALAAVPPPPVRQLVDWPGSLSDRKRHQLAIACCASGASARLPQRLIVDIRTGRQLPPPPSRPRKKKPR